MKIHKNTKPKMKRSKKRREIERISYANAYKEGFNHGYEMGLNSAKTFEKIDKNT